MKKQLYYVFSVALVLLAFTLRSQTTYYTRANGNWSANTTWSTTGCGGPAAASIPGPNDNVVICNNRNVTVDGNYTCNSLTIQTGNNPSFVTINTGFSLTVNDYISINAYSNNADKYIFVAGGTLTVKDLYINGANLPNINSYLRLGSNGNVYVTEDIVMNETSANTFIFFSSNATLHVGGTISGGGLTSNPSGGPTPPTFGTVNFYANGDQLVPSAYTYFNLRISNSGTKYLDGNLTLNGDLTVTSNATFSDQGYTITGATGKIMTVQNNGTFITLLGTPTVPISFPANMTVSLAPSSTVQFNGNQNATLPSYPTDYGNVVFGGTSLNMKTLPSGTPINIQGNLTINANNVFNDNGNLVNVYRNLTVNGFHIGSGRIVLKNGTSAHLLSGNGLVTNLELDDVQGASLNSNFTINSNLILTNGLLRLNNYNLTIASSASITGSFNNSKMIVTNGSGYLRKAFMSGPSSFLFPIGDITGTPNYSPIKVTFTEKASGYLSVRVKDNVSPNINPSDIPNHLSRYWEFATSGLNPYSYTLEAYYDDEDVVGSGESNFKLRLWNGTSWLTDVNSTIDVNNNIAYSALLANSAYPLNNGELTLFVSADENSYIASGDMLEPQSIDASNNDYSKRIDVFDFKIVDQGTSDALPTKINQITFTQGPANEISNWTTIIGGATLYGPDLGGTSGSEITGVVNSNNIVFNIPSLINVSDNSNETYTLRIWLKDNITGINDCSKLDFALTYQNLSVTSGSSKFGSGGVSSGAITVRLIKDSTSTISAGTGVEPTAISSIIDSESEKYFVFDFNISDVANNDNLPTIIESLTIVQGSTNNISDWTKVIAGAKLIGDDGEFTGTITSNSIVFSQVNMITVNDNTEETYQLYIWLKPDLSQINDNDILNFAVDCNNLVVSDCGSSLFGLCNVESGSIKVDIIATRLTFSNTAPPDFTLSNENFNVIVYAVDENGNLDKDFNGDVVLSLNTGNGVLSSVSGLTKTAINGVASWNDVQYSIIELFVIEANSSGLEKAISKDINAVAEFSYISLGPAVEPASIPSFVNTYAQRFLVFDFNITDVGTGDSLNTIINEIVIRQGTNNEISDWTKIFAGATLYGPDLGGGSGSEMMGTVMTDKIIFSNPGMITVENGTTETYQLFIWLKNDLSNIKDNDKVEFYISDATVKVLLTNPLTSSIIGTGSAQSGPISIDIIATRLKFLTGEPPTIVGLNNNFKVTVYAVDDFDNIDVNANNEVTLSLNSGSGSISSASGLVKNLVNGTYTWTDVKYNSEGIFTLLASSPSLSSAISWEIQCILDKNSKVEVGPAVEPSTISSLIDDVSERFLVFDIKFTDLGTSDGLPTIIQKLVFRQGSLNEIPLWTEAIAGATLYGPDLGAVSGAEAVGIVNDDNIEFNLTNLISISDGSSEVYQLRIWLYKTLNAINDNDGFDFKLAYSDVTTASIGSSRFGEGEPTSGLIKVDIKATKLIFINNTPPPIVGLDFDFVVGVAAVDENGNIDRDANDEVTLIRESGTGTLTSATGLTKNLVNGVFEWSDVRYNFQETFTIKALSSALPEVISGPIICKLCISTATYTSGIIEADDHFDQSRTDSRCPGTLNVNIPTGANIVGVNVFYTMTSKNPNKIKDQRSQIWCTSPGGTQSSIYSGVGNGSGSYDYAHYDLNIANGVTGGGDITFQMHAGDFDKKGKNCHNGVYVNNNSWTVAVAYVVSGVSWIGVENTDWHNENNWACGILPTSATDVVIPAGVPFQPHIYNGDAEVKSITINPGASLTMSNSRTLNVYGSFTNNGVFVSGNANETVVFKNGGTVKSNGHAFNNVELDAPSLSTMVMQDNITIKKNFTIKSGTWDVNVSGNYTMTVGGNWTNLGTFQRRNGTVIFNGTSIINSGGTATTKRFNNVILNGTSATQADHCYIAGNFTIQSGTWDVGAGNYLLYVTRDWTNSGTFVPRLGTVYFMGVTNLNSGGIANGKQFYHVRAAGTSVTQTQDVRIDGNLFIQSGVWDVSINNHNIYLSGNWTNNATFVHSAGTVYFKGNSVITTNGTGTGKQFYNIVLDGTSATLAGSIKINKNFTILNGTWDVSTSNYDMYVAGDWLNNGTFVERNGTVYFDGISIVDNGGITVGKRFYNLTLSGIATFLTLNRDIYVINNLTIIDGTFDVSTNNFNIYVGGNWVNNGSFVARNGTVIFNNISTIMAGGTAAEKCFWNVELNGTSATLASDIKILNNFTITSGTWSVSVANYRMYVGGNWTNSGTFTHSAGTVYFIGNSILNSGGTGAGKQFYNIVLDGSTLRVDGNSVKINNNLTIVNGTFILPSTYNLNVARHLMVSSAGVFSHTGTGTVTLDGNQTQLVNFNGAVVGNVQINNVSIPSAANGVMLMSKLELRSDAVLTLRRGLLITNGNMVIINNTSTNAVVAEATNVNFNLSWIYGTGNTSCLRRYIAKTIDTYYFPVGTSTKVQLVELHSNNLSDGNAFYIDAWYNPNPTNPNTSFPLLMEGGTYYTSVHTDGVWVLNATGTIQGTYNLKLYFNGRYLGLEDYQFNILKRPTGSTTGANWTLDGKPKPTMVVQGYVQRDSISSFSEFGVGITNEALPVELLSFTAECENDYVKLEWITASEYNNSHFNIEKSINGRDFNLLTSINGVGFSNTPILYTYMDDNIVNGPVYYRLIQVDYNGTIKTYAPISINCSHKVKNNYSEVYYDNIYDMIYVTLSTEASNISLELYDIRGALIYSQDFKSVGNNNQLIIDAKNISTGIYLLKVVCDNLTCIPHKVRIIK